MDIQKKQVTVHGQAITLQSSDNGRSWVSDPRHLDLARQADQRESRYIRLTQDNICWLLYSLSVEEVDPDQI